MRKKITAILLLLLLLTACSQDNNANIQENEYEKTKHMVIDMLKTDDGKATLAEILAEEEMKEQLVMNQEVIKSSIEKNLTSEKAISFWKEAFQDPSFAAAYAKSLKTAHIQLLKDLMQDPDYRSLLLEVLQDPKMDKQINKVIQSTDAREEIKNAIIETFESPLVQEKLQSILSKTSESPPPQSANSSGESSQTDTGSGGKEEGGSEGGNTGGGNGMQ